MTRSQATARKVREEVDAFKTEYPFYDAEIVSGYLELLDDFSQYEKEMFLELLGY